MLTVSPTKACLLCATPAGMDLCSKALTECSPMDFRKSSINHGTSWAASGCRLEVQHCLLSTTCTSLPFHSIQQQQQQQHAPTPTHTHTHRNQPAVRSSHHSFLCICDQLRTQTDSTNDPANSFLVKLLAGMKMRASCDTRLPITEAILLLSVSTVGQAMCTVVN